MSSHIFTFEINSTNLQCQSCESFDTFFTSSTNLQNVNSNHQRAPPNPYISTNFLSTSVNLPFSPWRPSKKLFNLYNKFQDQILYQYPCIPCSYCSKLMYPSEARWVHYDPTFLYPLEESFPSTLLQFHPNDPIPSRIAVCCSCLNPSTRRHPPKVDPIPDEIQNVPIHLQGSFGYSRNINAFALYTGTVGAILSNGERNSWYHPSLLNASKWLRENNEFFKPYRYYFNQGTINGPPLIIPTATISEFNENLYRNSIIRNTGPTDIVISGNDFDTEIHNEDYRYERLMAGFMTTDMNESQLPISFSDNSLEALIFPDLFPLGRYHFADIRQSRPDTRYKIDTYGNYIKLAIMCPDLRFRLHWYWPHYSYINLEKYRNHQNKTRLIRQKITDNHTLPTVTDLITESVYSGRKIIDESFTTTLPSFIRTDPLPSNRPFHTYHHYTNRLQSLHHYLWNNPTLSNLGKWLHYFEHDEFQNRGAIHTHGVAWLDKSIPKLIASNAIRADMPDPITEPELYQLVKKHQIHRCIPSKCGGPCNNNGQCNQKFPKPLSEITYFDNETGRFVYRRTKPEDQWVVSYHAPTLLLWEAHHNFQYVTDKHFAKYMCKYVTKPEPSDLFDIQETDAYRRHIHARRLGTMELMLLLMGKKVSRCTIAVDFLPTSPPGFRLKAVKPAWMIIEQEDTDPYYENAIEKYFERPDGYEFDILTYPEYFRKYKIASQLNRNQLHWNDKKNRIIIKRKKEILVRFQYLTIKNAEPFFYQQLLFNKSSRSENELKGNHSTY
ncbi:DNA helicase Pif1, ATP-dependent [Rhizophagus clarus]|uniref:DNA helicase Pif1, ATP-dependent n=1 Tax=Rhizophagus clarus TaxID=94130 RepID=A0A8H3M5T2_9GLOM|nr:DNA helicase Pif1, ATP-dependent [Rhizophagus clarus]